LKTAMCESSELVFFVYVRTSSGCFLSSFEKSLELKRFDFQTGEPNRSRSFFDQVSPYW
jgi:hypothetical protein